MAARGCGSIALGLHRSGMTHSIRVLHAVAESANIRHVVASQQRFSALAVRRLRWRLGSDLSAGRLCDVRNGWGWSLALPLRTPRDTHETMPHS